VVPQVGYSIIKRTVQPVYSCCCWRRAPRGRTPRASQQAPSHLPGWGGGWHLAHISCERTWAQRRGQQGFIGGRGPPQQTVTRPQSGPAWYLSSNSPKGGSDLPPPPPRGGQSTAKLALDNLWIDIEAHESVETLQWCHSLPFLKIYFWKFFEIFFQIMQLS